jgi:hypothetical protein
MRYNLKHFETFFTAREGAHEPSGDTGAVIAVLTGPLQATRLQESLDRAILQHPALRAGLVQGKSAKGKATQEWDVADKVRVPLRVAEVSAGEREACQSLFDGPIDLTHDCPLRVSILQQGSAKDSSLQTLRIDFHGALCDAPSALLFLEDVMGAYAFEHGAERGADLSFFADRQMEVAKKTHFSLIFSWFVKSLVCFFALLLRSFKGKPEVGGAQSSSADPTTLGGAVQTFQLTPEQAATFAAVGRRSGGGVTDVILRDVLSAFNSVARASNLAWTNEILIERSQRRGGTATRLPQASLCDLAWLSMGSSSMRDRSTLLRGVISKLAYLDGCALSVLDVMILRRIRSTLAHWARGHSALLPAPLVFHDVGVPFATSFLPRDADGAVIARGVKIESVSVLPPLWGIGAWSLGVVHYRRALRFALRCDPKVAPSNAPREVMARLEEQFYETASEPGRETIALDALIEAHARMKQSFGPLRSLPIGKHVSPEARRLKDTRHLGAALPESAQGPESSESAVIREQLPVGH